MKHYFLAIFFSCILFTTSAQEQGKIRFGGDLSLTLPSHGAGVGGDLDLRYNITDRLNAGIRTGFGYMLRDYSSSNSQSYTEATIHLNNSFLLTGDYYFPDLNHKIVPFVGTGFGFYRLYDFYFYTPDPDQMSFHIPDFPSSTITVGALLRTGFEVGRFRMSLEYNMIPNTRRYDVTTLTFDGRSRNSYLTINLGFYIGGGSWKRDSEW